MNCILSNMVKSIITNVNRLISLWGGALLIASYIFNRVPSKSISTIPYELWIGKKPNLNYFSPLGVDVFFMYQHRRLVNLT